MARSPACVGTYEQGHPSCDGDRHGAEEDHVPCAWRNRCVALGVYCKAQNREPDTVVADLDHEQLLRLCEQHIGEHGVVDGVIGAAHKKHSIRQRKREPDGQYVRKARKPSVGPGNAGRIIPEFAAAVTAFEQQLRKGLPGARFVVTMRLVLVRAGTLYRLDKTATKGAFMWYCTTTDKPRPIAKIRYVKTKEAINIDLGLTLAAARKLPADVVAKLGLRKGKIVAHYYQTCAPRLDEEGAALCGTSVAALLKAGAFDLPGCDFSQQQQPDEPS